MRHIVVFKFQASSHFEQRLQVVRAFQALQNQIPGIVAFEHGQNVSPEGLDQGFDHVFVLTFQDALARDAYLPHPAHQAFGEFLGRVGVVESVFVVDFVPTD